MRLLITRPASEGARTAAALQSQGHETLLAPLLRLESLAADFGTGPWDGVIMTSGNAARALTDHPRRGELLPLKVFAVGRSTAQAARACGFGDVVSADGDVSDLLDLLTRSPPRAGRLLYLAGADLARDLAGDFRQRGFTVVTQTTYRMVPVSSLPRQTSEAFAANHVEAVLHYSRRSAAAFLEAVRAAGVEISALSVPQFCVSAGVASVLREAGATGVMAAASPDENALFALLDRALRTQSR